MRKWSLGLLMAALFCLGLSSTLEAVETKKVMPPEQHPSTASKQLPGMTPQSVGDGIVRMIAKPKTSAIKVSAKTAVKTTAAAKTSRSRTASKGGKEGIVPPPKAAEPQIRQEIQKILDLDKKIKSLQVNKSAQLQRIQEQARIHQRILGELEASKKTDPSKKPLDKESLLAQEKLRIIRDETQRNSKMVDEIQKKSAGGTLQATAKEKPPAA